MTENLQENYRIHDNVVYHRKSTPHADFWVDCGVRKGNVEPAWKKAKIPYALWEQARGFCLWTQKKFKAEGIVLFFYGEEQGWNVWAPPQKTWGMTLDVDEKNPLYEKQRADMPELMLGSLHHHCTSFAFQSGTDETDETNKDGIHFTLGKLDEPNLDIHARFVYQQQCFEVSPTNWIEMPDWVTSIPIPSFRYKAAQTALSVATENSFPDFWKKNITKGTKSYSANTYGYNPKTGVYSSAWDDEPEYTFEEQRSELQIKVDTVEELQDELNISLWELGYIMNDDDIYLNEEELAAKAQLPALLKKYEISESDLAEVIQEETGYEVTDFSTEKDMR